MVFLGPNIDIIIESNRHFLYT